ncbi:MAG: HAMP domain-containing sensor histidine kinase [Bacilli bacterium]|nr:HAMP domain-containing sensor histidine kinase [bacterium]MDY2696736.1 HAMP domain-containing sensor histidine kinase [Bacilli bacterium]
MRHINKLSKQLVWLVGFIFVILFIILGLVLPKMLIPVAENNIYNYLREPLQLVNANVDYKLLDTEIAYIYVVGDSVLTTKNLQDELGIDNVSSLMKKITNEYGKIEYKHKYYYYYAIENERVKKIAITNDSYINKTKTEILGSIFPVVLGTCLLIGLILIAWSTIIVKKIEKLKDKVDNIDNPDYNHKIDFEVDDEIKSLGLAIEDMRLSLINQEEYRNQMYQNISHDFKTPLTVIKSYIEAVEDGVEDEATALNVIKEQTSKLEQKVHSLLYLNKLDYLKDSKNIELVPVDMEEIIKTEVEKFKFYRKELNFIVEYDKKSQFVGTVENWETILDNLLGNFIRYATTTIKITAKQNKLILYNDGDNISNDYLEGIFTPFRKGIKGQFGLGLSIVKKTLNIMNYDITINNEKKGVSFIITKRTHK